MQDALKAKAATTARTPRGERAQTSDAAAPASLAASVHRSPRAARRRRPGSAAESEIAGIRITSARRVIDADSGTHKLELVRYYARVARWILPHLRERPVSLVRAPRGLSGETFFQRHSGRAPLPELTEHEGLDPGHPALLTIDTPTALVSAAQMDVIELHTWNACVGDIERPDRVVFDLDPDPALGWDRMIEAAQRTRALLAELGLESFCKTSGGKGLHVVVPLTPAAGWDEVKAFSRAAAQHLASMWPTQFTATMGPEHRKKKIFIDYLRNARGASTAAAYGVRARPGMGVSVPIAWDELEATTGGAHWILSNIDTRLAAIEHADPWGAYGRVQQKLTAELTFELEAGGK
ncbi:non-homologous end-joining DNA ligase [Paraburkholderia unamae]|uniref:DNA ligase D n=1 Tax=Paraburkholderia unamae TaxID=219649 RepID=A0ABX5KAT0_9BURK|nr:DNA ligase D [Paraburkholderia unamae]CAG9258988.1 Bifunctional non-homologous end joining protein LigD [Paraburkholderia unamae]